VPLLGAHVSASGGLHRAVERADALGCEALQLFTHNPLQWQGRGQSPAAVDAFRRALLGSKIKRAVAHASYLINLAGDGYVRARSEEAVAREIDLCYQLGIDSLVLHPGSSKGSPRDVALARLAESLGKILGSTGGQDVTILLETMAGQGNMLGSDYGELESVIDELGWDRRLGVCVDLCHISMTSGARAETSLMYPPSLLMSWPAPNMWHRSTQTPRRLSQPSSSMTDSSSP